jgi:hypothetical protein
MNKPALRAVTSVIKIRIRHPARKPWGPKKTHFGPDDTGAVGVGWSGGVLEILGVLSDAIISLPPPNRFARVALSWVENIARLISRLLTRRHPAPIRRLRQGCDSPSAAAKLITSDA